MQQHLCSCACRVCCLCRRLACGERHPCVNRIHGRLPASLGALTALQVLCLRDNALTGRCVACGDASACTRALRSHAVHGCKRATCTDAAAYVLGLSSPVLGQHARLDCLGNMLDWMSACAHQQ